MNYDQSHNLLNEEICNLIDSIKANPKQNSKIFSKMRPLEIIPEDRVKLENKKTINKGLTENILNDFETKEKARKGLLYIFNKISEGSFCPDIVGYFTQVKKDNLQKKKEFLNHIRLEDDKETSRMKSSTNLRRQNLIDNKIPKFRVSEEEIFKLNCDPSQLATMTVLKSKKNGEREKDVAILRKRKNEIEKKLNFATKIFPDKNYKNDISSKDKDFKLFYSDDDEMNNPFFKFNKKKKYLNKTPYGKNKNRSNKEEMRRIGILNSNVQGMYRNDSIKMNLKNNTNNIYRNSYYVKNMNSNEKENRNISNSSSREI